ncbi:C-type lectin-like domain-containing protein [Chryseobacterium aureum]|uniref:hypothetical protein n=1 Tax=Chryseobacterium aureum TaxID=2497456 RepID=UPI000F88B5F7|nr:hypothetical protein [Chryseobacterium aureum]
MKNFSLPLAVLLSGIIYSQVGINNTAPQATMDITAKTTDGSKPEGLIAPRLTGDQIRSGNSSYSAPQTGTLIYATTADSSPAGKTINITAPGYYYFDGTVWQKMDNSGSTGSGSSSTFSASILGYDPVKSSNRTVPPTFSGVSVTEVGCKKNTGNGHVYCAYNLGAALNFYNTFSLAKAIGGYVVTMTSDAERIWVNNNILATGTGYNLNSNIWIGYNKVAYPGNPTQFVWITGEDWVIDWTTSPNSTPQNWFNAGEPNNSGGNEGSCHIWTTASFANRKWNDINGTTTNSNGPFNQTIVEFNEE